MHKLAIFLMLFTCTTEIFCAAASSRDCVSSEEKGTGVLDIDRELIWIKGIPLLEVTIACHLGLNSDWEIRDYEELYFQGGCVKDSDFSIAIVEQRIGTSIPGRQTYPKCKRLATMSSSAEFQKLAKQSFFEIKRDQQLLVNNKISTYVAAYAFADSTIKNRFLFLCSDRDEEVKVQELLTQNTKTVHTVGDALQLIYPNVNSSSTYILFDAARYYELDQKIKEGIRAFERLSYQIRTSTQPKKV